MTTEIEKRPVASHLPMSLQDLEGWGGFAIKAGLVPTGTNMYQAMAIVQTGREMGLGPLQSLRMMSFVNNRLCMGVQLQLAMALARGVKIGKIEEGDDFCIATLERDGKEVTCKYTKDDAIKAGLTATKTDGSRRKRFDKVKREYYDAPDGSWEKYQRQMLRWRAFGDALRLIAPDCVMGLLSPEEAASIEPLVSQTPEKEELESFDFDGKKAADNNVLDAEVIEGWNVKRQEIPFNPQGSSPNAGKKWSEITWGSLEHYIASPRSKQAWKESAAKEIEWRKAHPEDDFEKQGRDAETEDIQKQADETLSRQPGEEAPQEVPKEKRYLQCLKKMSDSTGKYFTLGALDKLAASKYKKPFADLTEEEYQKFEANAGQCWDWLVKQGTKDGE